MKKIIIVLIMVFSLSLISCDKNKNNKNEYKFISKEEINEKLSIFYCEVELFNVNGEIDSLVVAENNNSIYYKYKETNYLMNKSDKTLYFVDEDLSIKLLEQQKEFDYNKNKSIIVDLLGEHIDIIDEEYQKKDDIVEINGFKCEEYESLKKIDDNNYVRREFYIDQNTGFCVKQDYETCSAGIVKASSWEVKEFTIDGSVIDEYFSKYDNYIVEVAPLEFDLWPTLGLGVILPKLTVGKFMFGIDYGDNAVISVNELTLVQTKSYISTLVNHGFNEGKGITNVSGQYIYITYNADFVMVRISYTPSDSSLTIKLVKSTQEEIDKEMSKLK